MDVDTDEPRMAGSREAPIIVDEEMDSPVERDWVRSSKSNVEEHAILEYITRLVKATHNQRLKVEAGKNLKSYKSQYKEHSNLKTEVAKAARWPNVLPSGAEAAWVEGRIARSNYAHQREDEFVESIQRLDTFSNSEETDPSVQLLALAMKARNQRLVEGSFRTKVQSAQEELERVRELPEHKHAPPVAPGATDTDMVDLNLVDNLPVSNDRIFEIQDRLDAIRNRLEEAEEWATASYDETKEEMNKLVATFVASGFKADVSREVTAEPSNEADQQALEGLRVAKFTFEEHQRTCEALKRLLFSRIEKSKGEQASVVNATAELESSNSTLDALDAELAEILGQVSTNVSRMSLISDEEKQTMYEETKDMCKTGLQTTTALLDLNPQYATFQSSRLLSRVPTSEEVVAERKRLDNAHINDFKKLQKVAFEGIADLLTRARAQQDRLEQEHRWGMTGT